LIASIPSFEEFTEKPQYRPSVGFSPSAPAGARHPADRGEKHESRPTELTPVIRVVAGELRVDSLKWGLIPPHEPMPSVSYSTFNAKSETVARTPAFAHAWKARQRCLVPADAFFEWKGVKSPKQKYRITVKGQPEFFMAGLWEKWEGGGRVLETFTIITTVANELVAEIHDKKRMPVIIAPEDVDRWLNATSDVSDLLKPYPSEAMEAVPIDTPRPRRDDGPTLFPTDD